MKIIREVFRWTGKDNSNHAACVIRTDTYASTFAHIEFLVEHARRDFPDLQSKDIEVVKFGGMRYKRTMGIEFNADPEKVPSTYANIRQREYLL